jgi:hypothetical protein
MSHPGYPCPKCGATEPENDPMLPSGSHVCTPTCEREQDFVVNPVQVIIDNLYCELEATKAERDAAIRQLEAAKPPASGIFSADRPTGPCRNCGQLFIDHDGIRLGGNIEDVRCRTSPAPVPFACYEDAVALKVAAEAKLADALEAVELLTAGRDVLGNIWGRVSCAVHAIDGKGDNTGVDDVIARLGDIHRALQTHMHQANWHSTGRIKAETERDQARLESERWAKRCESGWTHPNDVLRQINELTAEVERLEAGLEHIAAGNISPSIDFAKRILDGDDVKTAHAALEGSGYRGYASFREFCKQLGKDTVDRMNETLQEMRRNGEIE